MSVPVLIFVFIISFAGTFLTRILAIKRHIIDIPNSRSSHTHPTPRGGGLAVSVAWFTGVIILFLTNGIPDNLFAALACGIPITLTGLADDILTLAPKVRLAVQVLCASLALFFLGGINSIDLGFTILHSPLFFNVLAVIGIVWLINLFNFLDGIDGYISTEIIFICIAAYFITGADLPVYLAAATAGFLIWNWQPAKIFMGDVGSTLLGFTVGVFAIYYQNVNESSILIWLMITSLFWFDATFTLFRRFKNHEKLSQAHKKHAYQRIVQSGFSHQKTVIYSIGINLFLIGLVWFALKFQFLLLPLFFIDIIFLYLIMKLIDRRLPFSYNN